MTRIIPGVAVNVDDHEWQRPRLNTVMLETSVALPNNHERPEYHNCTDWLTLAARLEASMLQPAPAHDLSPPRPTVARYGVLCFLGTLSLLLYIDRVCIGQAETWIREELRLTKSDMG